MYKKKTNIYAKLFHKLKHELYIFSQTRNVLYIKILNKSEIFDYQKYIYFQNY